MEALEIILYIFFVFVFLPFAITGISYLLQILYIGKKDKINLTVYDKEDYKLGKYETHLFFENITLDRAMFLKSVFEDNNKICYITILSQERKTKKHEQSEVKENETTETNTTEQQKD